MPDLCKAIGIYTISYKMQNALLLFTCRLSTLKTLVKVNRIKFIVWVKLRRSSIQMKCENDWAKKMCKKIENNVSTDASNSQMASQHLEKLRKMWPTFFNYMILRRVWLLPHHHKRWHYDGSISASIVRCLSSGKCFALVSQFSILFTRKWCLIFDKSFMDLIENSLNLEWYYSMCIQTHSELGFLKVSIMG